jgi:hypothetical protein
MLENVYGPLPILGGIDLTDSKKLFTLSDYLMEAIGGKNHRFKGEIDL